MESCINLLLSERRDFIPSILMTMVAVIFVEVQILYKVFNLLHDQVIKNLRDLLGGVSLP